MIPVRSRATLFTGVAALALFTLVVAAVREVAAALEARGIYP